MLHTALHSQSGQSRWLEISLADQRVRLHEGSKILLEFPVSSASRGAGERHGSLCTPRGWHVIRARIGSGCPANTVFVGRRPTGEILTPELYRAAPGRDWILTRILWLSGLEPGRNRLGEVDTMRRYIYMHGMPDEEDISEPGSHGCIRMRNTDIMHLYDEVAAGTPVLITEQPLGTHLLQAENKEK